MTSCNFPSAIFELDPVNLPANLEKTKKKNEKMTFKGIQDVSPCNSCPPDGLHILAESVATRVMLYATSHNPNKFIYKYFYINYVAR